MDCLVFMVIALYFKESINLTKLAKAFPSSAKPDSSYRRMQRFISDPHTVEFDSVAWFIMKLFDFLETDYYLTFDRTNWQWGKKNINILTLAIVYKGIAIPIYWLLLNKKGNSSTRERIALVQRFIRQLGKTHIIKFLADREFVGEQWFSWLIDEGIDFGIRIKKNTHVTNSRGIFVQVQHLFRHTKPGETSILLGARTMTGVKVYLSALRLEDGELLIIASGTSCVNAVESYALRWEIETLFSCLKSRGFNFEDTHVTDRNRIKRLLVVAVIAFCWAHRVGEWQHEQVKPIKVKKHQRFAKSIFRVGLDFINDALFKLAYSFGNTVKLLFTFLDVTTATGSG
jgi:hypothetical protein